MYVGTHKIHPEGTPRGARSERRCNLCREWYPAKAALCPMCKTERPAFNKRLRVAMLDANRAKQIEAMKRAGG